MADIIPPVPLRPKWTDRQLIAAADLSAEQHWQDAQLIRLRRLVLGWGVVAGLEVLAEGDDLVIEPGYGITAAGSEVYLPDRFHWSELRLRIAKVCDKGDSPCSDPTERTAEENPATGAWLVLVPHAVESCPRPTLPEGCVHPGSAFAYTRQGMGLIPELRCDLPDRLLRQSPDCKQVNAFLEDAPVPMPDRQDDVLPLAWISCDQQEPIDIQMAQRRKLLPLSLLQDLVSCCNCDGDPVTPDPEPNPEPEPEPEPDSAWEKPSQSTLGKLIDQITHVLPRGAVDLKLSFGEVFAKDTPPFSRRNTPAVKEIMRGFAASLLVSDKKTLDYYFSGDYESLLEALDREEPLSRAERSRWEDLKERKLTEILQRGQHGYASLQSQYPDVLGKELARLDPASLVARFDKVDFAAIAALDWLRNRIIER